MTRGELPQARRPNERREIITAENLTRDTHTLLIACGVERSSSWVTRTVRDFLLRVPDGFPYGNWLGNRIELSLEQREQALRAHPELAYLLSYADPVGELAVRHVMAERKAEP